jgi:hypothetical protein
MYPATGCPLEFYEEIVLPFDERIKSALKSQKKVAKEAASAAVAATSEMHRAGRVHTEQTIEVVCTNNGKVFSVCTRKEGCWSWVLC